MLSYIVSQEPYLLFCFTSTIYLNWLFMFDRQ